MTDIFLAYCGSCKTVKVFTTAFSNAAERNCEVCDAIEMFIPLYATAENPNQLIGGRPHPLGVTFRRIET